MLSSRGASNLQAASGGVDDTPLLVQPDKVGPSHEAAATAAAASTAGTTTPAGIGAGTGAGAAVGAAAGTGGSPLRPVVVFVHGGM